MGLAYFEVEPRMDSQPSGCVGHDCIYAGTGDLPLQASPAQVSQLWLPAHTKGPLAVLGAHVLETLNHG